MGEDSMEFRIDLSFLSALAPSEVSGEERFPRRFAARCVRCKFSCIS
jgi:hypothetical protein